MHIAEEGTFCHVHIGQPDRGSVPPRFRSRIPPFITIGARLSAGCNAGPTFSPRPANWPAYSSPAIAWKLALNDSPSLGLACSWPASRSAPFPAVINPKSREQALADIAADCQEPGGA